LDEGGMDANWNAAAGPAVVEAWHQNDRLWQIAGYCADVPLSPGGGHGGLGDNIKLFDSSPGQHRRHAPAIMNIWNTSYQSPPTGSHFIALWNVMSGSNGITSESVFLLGTQYNEPFLGIGTTSPSASLHISSSLTGSVTDLFRIQNDFGVPIFKVKPDRIILRNSGSSANEVTMSVDSDNNFMINDTLGVNHTHMFIKSGSKKITLEVDVSSGDLKFKNASTGKELFRIRQPIGVIGGGETSASIFTEGDIIAEGDITASGNIKVAGDISARGAIYGGSPSTEIVSGSGQVLSGWHGSQTRIKILPKDFVGNDDVARMGIVVADAVAGNPHYLKVESANLEIYAYVIVPQGYKATGFKIAGTDTANRVYVWESCCVGCDIITLTDQGLGDPARYVGTEYDFDTEMVAGATNYVLIKVIPTATDDYIYGGYVNIEKINS
jgi:hypothetical protein